MHKISKKINSVNDIIWNVDNLIVDLCVIEMLNWLNLIWSEYIDLLLG